MLSVYTTSIFCIYYYIYTTMSMYIYTIQYHFQNMKGTIAKYCEICHKLTAAALESL